MARRHGNWQTLLVFSAGWNLVTGTGDSLGESSEGVIALWCEWLTWSVVDVVVEVGHVSWSISGYWSWCWSVALATGRWGLVRPIIETQNGCVVLSENTDWPGVDVVGITAALASESTINAAAIG